MPAKPGIAKYLIAAKPGIAKDLIEADDIGRKAVANFIDSLLLKKMSFTSPIKCYKLIVLMLVRSSK